MISRRSASFLAARRSTVSQEGLQRSDIHAWAVRTLSPASEAASFAVSRGHTRRSKSDTRKSRVL
jgi:hypothetical protein